MTSAAVVSTQDPLARVAQLPGVASAVAAARDSVDALLRHRLLRRRAAEVTAEASLRSARASAAMSGHEADELVHVAPISRHRLVGGASLR